MSKRKKHGYADRLKYMHMLEDGYSLIAAEWMYHPYHFEMYQS